MLLTPARLKCYRKPRVDPRSQTAGERAHARYPAAFELQRHPGAGRLIRSSTKQHQLAILWQFIGALLNLFCRQTQRPGDRARLILAVDHMSQIHHENFVTPVHHHLQLLGHDAGDAQAAQKTPPLKVLPPNPGEDESNQYDDCQTAKALSIVDNLSELIAEEIPKQHK